MKNILGFDSWTMASHNYARLVPFFRKQGYNIILVHIGSWGHDKNRPNEEIIDGLIVRDISYYQGKSIIDILRIEKPDAVIFLSTRAFAHQAAILYSSYLKIPTLHLYHGIVTVQSVNTTLEQAYKWSPLRLFLQLYQRFWKNFTLLIPVLFVALIRCRMPFIYWQNIIKDIFAKMINPQSSGTSLLTKTTLGCVYTDSDRVHMKITYNLNDNDIYTVGNPDLMHFGFDENDIGFQFNQNNFNFNKEIVYIDTGLIQAGFVFNSYGEYYQHLLITEQALANQGYSLAFKPHPDHYHNGELLSLLKESSIRIIHKEDFIGSIKLCAAVIVEPSTLSLIPALMGKTIFLANYNKLAKQKYGQILLEYPFSVILNDLIFFESLRDYLSNQVINVGFLDWVKNNSGPLPADKMPERVFFSLNNYFNKNA